MPGSPHSDAASPLYVELELMPGQVPVQGRVREPSGIDRPFSGWLELMGVIERICEHASERKEPSL